MKKSPSANAKGLELSGSPLLVSFRTFNCGKILGEKFSFLTLKSNNKNSYN